MANAVAFHDHDGIRPKLALGIPELPEAHGLDCLDARPLLRVNPGHTRRSENSRQEDPHRFHGTLTPSSAHTHAMQRLTSNSVVDGMQSRRAADYRWRRGGRVGVVFCR